MAGILFGGKGGRWTGKMSRVLKGDNTTFTERQDGGYHKRLILVKGETHPTPQQEGKYSPHDGKNCQCSKKGRVGAPEPRKRSTSGLGTRNKKKEGEHYPHQLKNGTAEGSTTTTVLKGGKTEGWLLQGALGSKEDGSPRSLSCGSLGGVPKEGPLQEKILRTALKKVRKRLW